MRPRGLCFTGLLQSAGDVVSFELWRFGEVVYADEAMACLSRQEYDDYTETVMI